MPYFMFEGPNGSGKTALVNEIKKHLESRGKSVIGVREPYGLGFGVTSKLFNLLEETVTTPRVAHMLMQTIRMSCQEWVEDLLKKKPETIVIQDRGFPSTFVYQVLQKVDIEDVIRATLVTQLVRPDILFILEISPEEAMKRMEERKRPNDEFIREADLRRVCEMYEDEPWSKSFNPHETVYLDATLPVEDLAVFASIHILSNISKKVRNGS